MLTHVYADLKTGVRLHYVTEGEGKLLLFLHGNPAFDFIPTTRENLADLVPNAKVVTIPEGSHIMIYDYADVVNALIKEFLQGADSADI